jgi:pyruvate,water dikinase
MPGVDGLAVAPVVPLDDVPDGAFGIAGYKATRLAELARHGFLVPPSVVVTTALDTFEAEEHSALLAALGPGPFAVRSSGSREDAAGASFAGQYVSVLGVHRAELAEAVRRVRASPSAARVAAYRSALAGADENGDVAVLIQPMIPATVAGVAFSADPISGDRDTILVNGVVGAGEALLEGRADGDQWVVRGASAHRRAGNGSLDRVLVEAVADLARRVAAVSGSPQDIEWAHDGDRLWLLQARPITALPEAVRPRPIPAASTGWPARHRQR